MVDFHMSAQPQHFCAKRPVVARTSIARTRMQVKRQKKKVVIWNRPARHASDNSELPAAPNG
jgi:hypothetical protein